LIVNNVDHYYNIAMLWRLYLLIQNYAQRNEKLVI